MAIRRRIRNLLSEIEAELIEMLPETAQAAHVDEPIYLLILCYIDTTTDEHSPFVAIVPERVRQRAIKRTGAEASRMIWFPRQLLGGSSALIREQSLENPALQAKIETCYELLTENSSDDDDITLLPFREMFWRVARTLNERDWRGILNTTDDFVVAASDWSGFWSQEDLSNSLPSRNRHLLESRKLLFYQRTAEEIAEEQRQLETVMAELSSKTTKERIIFWIDELHLLSTEKTCLLSERGWTEKVALHQLQALGTVAIIPLLDLAEQLDAMPEVVEDQSSTAAEVLSAVFSTIEDIGRADAIVERRLRAMLASACKSNQNQPTWRDTPFLCAYALSRLFGYPWPSRDYNHVLADADSYISVPLKTQ